MQHKKNFKVGFLEVMLRSQRMNVSAYESRVCGLSENQKNVGSHQQMICHAKSGPGKKWTPRSTFGRKKWTGGGGGGSTFFCQKWTCLAKSGPGPFCQEKSGPGVIKFWGPRSFRDPPSLNLP